MISGDAHFTSGGNFQFQTLSGDPGTFVSFYDPIIVADGDVVFGDYTGVALKVEATGSIEAGDIVITGPDTTFMPDGSGSDEDLLGSSRAAILRAGVDSVSAPNIPQVTGGATFAESTLAGQPPGSIVVSSINTSNTDGGDGGPIILSATGNIITAGSFENPIGERVTLGSFSYSNTNDAGNGGAISISSISGDITTNSNLDSYSYSGSGNSGNGGAISISSISGDITTFNELNSYSLSLNGSGDGGAINISSDFGNITTGDLSSESTSSGDAGNGGAINLSSTSGDITNGNSDSFSDSFSGDAGNGGLISISSVSGNITTSSLSSTSYSFYGDAGNGGTINVSSISGDIITSGFSTSGSYFGNAGNGGTIKISSDSGNISTNENLSSASFSFGESAENGGNISISSISGNIEIGYDISSSLSLENVDFNSINPYVSEVDVSAGSGGAISISSVSGNIITNGSLDSSLYIKGGNYSSAGSGGAISISSVNGDITSNSSINSSLDAPGYVGSGGAISISSVNGDITSNSFISSSLDSSGFAGSGGVISISSVNGDITSNSSINSSLDAFGYAENGGSIQIHSKYGNITNNSPIYASISGGESGGSITISSISGNISNNNLIESRSSNFEGAGDGGEIFISSVSGDIINSSLDVSSLANFGGGNGGRVNIYSSSGTIINNGYIDASAIADYNESGFGGEISISTISGNIINNSSIAAISASSYGPAGDGGTISISSQSGNIASNSLRTFSTSSTYGGGGNGGDIVVSSMAGDISVSGEIDSSSGLPGEIILPEEQLNPIIFRDPQLNGTAGEVSIRGNQIALADTDILTTVSGQGNAGKISLLAKGAVTITNSSLISGISPGSLIGNGANIEISGESIKLVESVLNSAIFGFVNNDRTYNAGDISLSTDGDIVLKDSSVFSFTTGSGNAGDISFTAGGHIDVSSNSLISSIVSFGASGEGGDIILEAAKGVLINGLEDNPNDFPALEDTIDSEFSTGNAANPDVPLPNLIPFARKTGKSTDGILDIYSFTVNAPGTQFIFDIDNADADGDLNTALRLTNVFPEVDFGRDGRNVLAVNKNAPQSLGGEGSNTNLDPYLIYIFDEPGVYYVEVLGEFPIGLGENLVVQRFDSFSPEGTYTLNISKIQPSSGITTQTSSAESAGNISIDSPSLTLDRAARISAATQGRGNAGTIRLKPFEDGKVLSLNFIDSLSTISSASLPIANNSDGSEVAGNGGNIILTAPEKISLSGQGTIQVTTETAGVAGDIDVTSPFVVLDNGIEIAASSGSAEEGGNINFVASDILLLRRGSFINAESTNASGGRGGNINIDTGFLIAVPNENSDIIANAFGGDGGRINIKANLVLGFSEQSGFTTDQLRDNLTSDISASSQLGQQGIVDITTLEEDPSRSFTELPIQLESPEPLQTCQTAGAEPVGSFISTGRGGLPLDPTEPLSNTDIWEDIQLPTEHDKPSSEPTKVTSTLEDNPSNAIVAAGGWVVNDRGEVELVAEMPSDFSHRGCPVTQSSTGSNVELASGMSASEP